MHSSPELSFDQWRALYDDDPHAFEARRQTELTIAITRYAPLNPQLRLSLIALENQSQGKSGPERAQLAMAAMASSLAALHQKFDELDQALKTMRANFAAVKQLGGLTAATPLDIASLQSA